MLLAPAAREKSATNQDSHNQSKKIGGQQDKAARGSSSCRSHLDLPEDVKYQHVARVTNCTFSAVQIVSMVAVDTVSSVHSTEPVSRELHVRD